jgi:long-chain fatty acid transport protein
MRKTIFLGFAVIVLSAVSAMAQNTDIEALAGINFNFANPGARSLGMGGAFLGLADDASAAEANPAGLTTLKKPEISLEGRNFKMSQDVNVTGTFPDLTSETFSSFSHRTEVSFASVVLPQKNWAVAAYYDNPLTYHNAATVLEIKDARGIVTQEVPHYYFAKGGTAPISLAQCQQFIQDHPEIPGACLGYFIFPFVSAVDVKLKTYGGAFAFKAGTVSVGVAARYQKFNEAAFTFREDFDGNPNSIVVQATGKLVDGQLQLKEAHDITWSAGFKWAPRENFSVGGVYKKGAQFDAPTFGRNAGEEFGLVGNTKFHVPDIAGLGLSFRPLPVLTLNADAVRVTYSNLTDNFISVNAAVRAVPHAYEAKDVTEIHAGAEYFLSTKIPVAIRAGWWRDPAHAVKYVGPLNDPNIVTAALLFPGSTSQNHYSAGVGLAWPAFQIDAAYETSALFKVGSLSAVFRF